MVSKRVSFSRTIRLALIALVSCVLIRTGAAQVYEGRELVKAELLVDTAAVVPGKPFTVGLWLRMVPGWHTYWKFPGDAGIPTEIKWNLPPGWKAGWRLPWGLLDWAVWM